MISDPPTCRLVWLFACLLLICLAIHAQQAAELATPKTSITTSYQDSAEGLSRLLNDMLMAAKNDDRAALEAQVRDTAIPNYESWFVNNCGKEGGAVIAELYGRWLQKREEDFVELFLYLAHQEGDISVQKLDSQVMCKPVVPLEFYLAEWQTSAGQSDEKMEKIGYFFVFVDGKFRWASETQKYPDSIEEPKCLHQLEPKYPAEAHGQQGWVLLDTIVHADGSVKVLKVLDGDPVLSKAAIEAVQQRRCEPAMVNGWRRIERQITVEVFVKPH